MHLWFYKRSLFQAYLLHKMRLDFTLQRVVGEHLVRIPWNLQQFSQLGIRLNLSSIIRVLEIVLPDVGANMLGDSDAAVHFLRVPACEFIHVCTQSDRFHKPRRRRVAVRRLCSSLRKSVSISTSLLQSLCCRPQKSCLGRLRFIPFSRLNFPFNIS